MSIDIDEAIESVRRSPILKMVVVGSDRTEVRDTTNTVNEQTLATSWSTVAGALEPPYNPAVLADIYEASSALSPNVDAYKTNIDGNGYHLEPLLDLDADDLVEQVASAIYVERLRAREEGQVVPTLVPTLEEVRQRIDDVEDAMRLERARVMQFFDGCSVEDSFITLRKNTRQDVEVTGNGYWEVLRDTRDRVVQFVYVPPHQIRLLAQLPEFVPVQISTRVSAIAMQPEIVKRRFRRFVQIVDRKTVWYREFGDPRTMSSATGTYYKDENELKSKEKDVAPATEILHFKLHSPKGPYGVPRWIGNLLGVLGTRSAEEINYLYFENKSVPPMALIVSGGRVSSDSVNGLKDFIDNEIRGKRNFHKILIIEGEPMAAGEGDPIAGARMKIELRPLTQAQQSDALFQKYDERNADKIGQAFRLPRLLRGDMRDFNRATADAAMELAEAQVFGPERVEFDDRIQRVLGTLGIRYFRFRSKSVEIHDRQTLAEIIAKLTTANVLVPNDARELAGEMVFSRRLPKIEADWVFQPVMLSQVGIPRDMKIDGTIPAAPKLAPVAPQGGVPHQTGVAPTTANKARAAVEAARKSRLDLAAVVMGIRDEMEKADAENALADHVEATKSADELETETIRMPLDVMIRTFGLVPTKAA